MSQLEHAMLHAPIESMTQVSPIPHGWMDTMEIWKCYICLETVPINRLHMYLCMRFQVTRNSQKVIAKEMTSISSAVKSFVSICNKQEQSNGGEKAKMAMMKSLTSLIKDVQTLKKKVSCCILLTVPLYRFPIHG
jgi:hypothetical protein